MSQEFFRKIKINESKIRSELLKIAKISECFHNNESECNGIIKNAHSIQRNGRLSLLEENIDGNMKLYSFTELQINETIGKYELKPIGKASASTFLGFCDYHDTNLFSIIENDSFEDTKEQCFLYSYRGFAHSHHRKKEQLLAYGMPSKFAEIHWDKIHPAYYGTSIGFIEGEKVKKRFHQIYEHKTFEELETLVYKYDGFYPIACSASWSPKYSPKTNKPLNVHYDLEPPFERVFINVIPDINGTIVIFSCLPEHTRSILYIDEFDSLSNYKQNQILTSILIGEVENTFLSPYLYNLLTTSQRKQLIYELQTTTNFSTIDLKRHFISKLNFFDSKYKKYCT